MSDKNVVPPHVAHALEAFISGEGVYCDECDGLRMAGHTCVNPWDRARIMMIEGKQVRVILTENGKEVATAENFDHEGKPLPDDVWRITYTAGHGMRIAFKDIPADYQRQINVVVNALK